MRISVDNAASSPSRWIWPGAGRAVVRIDRSCRRVSLIAAAVVFLSGSLVIESLTGLVDREIGASSTLYLTLMYIEETFELLGVAGAAVALSSMFRVARRPGGLLLTFDGFRSRDA